jgi:hypothetical protein
VAGRSSPPAAAALAGMHVGDVMTPDPDLGGTWMSVAGSST